MDALEALTSFRKNQRSESCWTVLGITETLIVAVDWPGLIVIGELTGPEQVALVTLHFAT